MKKNTFKESNDFFKTKVKKISEEITISLKVK